ncbi:nickel-dependent hydrogenase large subunit [Desulfosarcina sp.]|uniref:nickel-dependent hydrogenase large subunit n=1 Tax=Desulfosarcina sp. TaxID=2027861 RepID=UPI00356180C4
MADPKIITSVNSIQVPEGGQATFNVRLSSRPRKRSLEVNVEQVSGDENIEVSSGREMTFSRRNYNQWQTVTLAASEDSDHANGQTSFRLSGAGVTAATVSATEVDNDSSVPTYQIVTDRNSISVVEGGTAVFRVKLSANPGQSVSVTVGHDSGDPDLSVVSGLTYLFDATNWDDFQPITVAAAEDGDDTGSQATFALSAAGTQTVYVNASEQDNDNGSTPPGRVVIDPVSRIEGHLRIEVEVDNGRVSKAWSTATLFRGVETILTGRDALDAPLITQRLCGVCTYVHDLASVRAIEDAVGVQITDNARIVRNLMLGAQFLHDHIVHFYHLHGLDWVDITSALSADAAATENLARAISPNADPIDFAGAQSRLQALVATGNLGPFANGYWGHSAYVMSPEENLLVTAHYLEALRKQATAAKMMAILGGKNPHPQSTVVGGVTCGGELSADRLNSFRAYLEETRKFVNTVYLPDLKAVAAKYPEWATVGSFSNFMACGEFPVGPNVPADLFMPRGLIINGDIYNVQAFDPIHISEHVARSWYAGSTDYHPEVGETVPNYTGMDLDSRYSWLKAPRQDGEAMEVGPLARVLVGYGLGQAEFVNPVHQFLIDTGLSEANLLSTLGRTAARGLETAIIGDAMVGWLDKLENNLSLGNKQIYQHYSMGTSSGTGFLEAPRGALGHWISIQGSTIDNYQMVVPTTWNLGPRCAEGIPGPLEQALVGTPVADPASPVEVIRVIHSFDPCIACGVHVIDTRADKTYSVKVV